MSNEHGNLTPGAEPTASVDSDFGPPPPPAEIPSRRVLREAARTQSADSPTYPGQSPLPENELLADASPQIIASGEVAEPDGNVAVVPPRAAAETPVQPVPQPVHQPAVNPIRHQVETARSLPVTEPYRQPENSGHPHPESYVHQQVRNPQTVAYPNYPAGQAPAVSHPQPVYQGAQYGANFPGAPIHPNQPPMHYVSMPPRRHSVFPAALAAALIGALLASGLTAAVMRAQSGASQAISFPIATNTDPGRVDEPLVTAATGNHPAWQEVISSVQDSVVAIDAQTPAGGSVGSGFIIDTAGHVLTNNHVVAGAAQNRVEVTLADGRLYVGEILGTDSVTDLALLQLVDVPADLHPVSLGDSDEVRVGDAVLAVGNPLGLSNTATTGIVSALDRPVTAGGSGDLERTTTNAIQIDAAVNPGNSGGPVFDATGRVIGVTSSIASLQGGSNVGSIGLGFAIPINLVKNITEQLISAGSAEHALMGVMIEPGTATADGVTRRGARVRSVNAGSPAEQAGVHAGDVIIAVNDRPVNSHESVTAIVREHRAGDVIKLTLVRNNQIRELAVTLAAMPQSQPQTTLTPDLLAPTGDDPEAIFPEDLAPPAETEFPTAPEN